MANYALGFLLSTFVFACFMMVRNHYAYKLSTAACDAIFQYNMRNIHNRSKYILDYDAVIRDYNEIMWDFTAWKNDKAYKTQEIRKMIVGI
jgi:hypothetical protein